MWDNTKRSNNKNPRKKVVVGGTKDKISQERMAEKFTDMIKTKHHQIQKLNKPQEE